MRTPTSSIQKPMQTLTNAHVSQRIPHVAAHIYSVYTCGILSFTCKPHLYLNSPNLCAFNSTSKLHQFSEPSTMANVRDEFGNPVQLTDERGNPVQLTDEFGNPVQLTGVATTGSQPVGNPVQMSEEFGNPMHPTGVSTTGFNPVGGPVQMSEELGNPMHPTGVATTVSKPVSSGGDVVGRTQPLREGHDASLARSSSSSSSSVSKL